MRSTFYAELAAQNLIKNRRFYLPYLLTCIGTAAMFYIMCALALNDGLSKMIGAATLGAVLTLGVFVIGIFAVLILIYTNSFLMKRRQKEFGLYNVLGMEKRHIGWVLLWESLYAYLMSMLLGLGLGALLSKLLLLMLIKLTGLSSTLTFPISGFGVMITLALFGAIFLFVFLRGRVSLIFSNPAELLRGGNVGEKEPKSKWVLAALGAATLGAGYYLAITVEEPLAAIMLFFVAVVLVIVGTYLMFIAGSIAILKLLKRNHGYYYRADHFTAVSGMLYRMKQNAAGLASICILCTMVLVMVSTTVSLYVGIEDGLRITYPHDIEIMLANREQTDSAQEQVIKDAVDASGVPIENWSVKRAIEFTAYRQENVYTCETERDALGTGVALEVMTRDEYERFTGEKLTLKGNEVAAFSQYEKLSDQFTLLNDAYTVVKRIASLPTNPYAALMMEAHTLVVSDDAVFDRINAGQAAVYGGSRGGPRTTIAFDMKGTQAAEIALEERLMGLMNQAALAAEARGEQSVYGTTYKRADAADVYALYGGLLFLGLFLGVLFMMATVLIIYYKQVSEGYDDAARFDIMRKVGMSRDEVKKSISSQIQTVFFLPLCAAVIHVAVAFKMITKLLALLHMTNVGLFVACSGVVVVMFAAVYLLVYHGTARTYYKIVAPAQ